MKTRLSIRIFLLSLAALVLFNGLGFYAFAYVKAGIHRVCLVENSSELQKLVLDNKDFSSINWVGSSDFIYEGQVYDCESVRSSNGKIVVSCYSDKEETSIKNSLAGSFDSNPAKSSSPAKDLLKFFPVYPMGEKIQIAFPQLCNEHLHSCISTTSLNTLPREVSSPPPELV